MKKLIIGLVVFFGILVAAAAAIPLFVDVDQYRPKIQALADENLNGKLELGKLSLSLWGQIRVEIDGLKLTDAQGRGVVSVQDAYFHLPFSSIFSGSPELVLKMNRPTISVTKARDGKYNVLNLVKSQAAQPAPGAPAAQPAPAEKKAVTLPGMVARARLGMELDHASLAYNDELSGMKTQVNDLNFKVRDLSLTRQTEMELTADLDTSMKSSTEPHQVTMVIHGPVKLVAQAKPTVVGGRFDHIDLLGNLNLDQLDIEMPNLFHKKPGVDAHGAVSLSASQSDVKVEQLKLKFNNAEIEGSGTVSKLPATPLVNASLKSNLIDLKPWAELVPMLKDYELGGSMQFDAQANGPSEKLGYQAHFKVNNLTAKAPSLKEEPKINAVVDVATDRIVNFNLWMDAPENNLVVRGRVNSFTAPQADFTISSQKLDLDRLINFPPPGEKAEVGKQAEKPGSAPAAGAQSNDALIAKLRENKMLQLATANLDWNFRMIKAKGVEVDDLNGRATMKDLLVKLESLSGRLFGGSIHSTADLQLKSRIPSYRFSGHADQLDLGQAVASQMHLFKNTVTGKAAFDITGQGASLDTKPAMENLNAKGKLQVRQATFATIDVAKMVTEALSGAIDKIADKIPALKGKKLGLPEGASKYELISSDFTIAGGKFNAPDFQAKAEPNKGIDIKGSTQVGLLDYSLKSEWTLIDTYNLTHAKDLSVNQSGVQINHVLAEGNGPVKFPISIGCTLTAPCYDYGQVAESLAKVALGNATGAAKTELRNRAADILRQKAPPGVQNQIQNGLKHLFGG